MPQVIPAIVAYGVQAATLSTLGTIGAGLAGAIAGGLVASSMQPKQKSKGPRLGDRQVQSSSYGTVIPFALGAPRLAGQVIWASEKKETKVVTESGGKGGGGQETTSYTYKVDLLILLTCNEQAGIGRVWMNGGLIWNKSYTANATTKAASDNIPQWTSITVYKGDAAQLPDPIYEAAVGLGNAPAYRGRLTAMLQDVDLGSSGQLPNFTFEIYESGVTQSYETLLLLHGDDFTDSSTYNRTPTIVNATVASVVYPYIATDLPSFAEKAFRFIEGTAENTHTYTVSGGFLPSGTTDYTFECFVDLVYSYADGYVAGRTVFLKLNLSTGATYEFTGAGSDSSHVIALSGAFGTVANEYLMRRHIMVVRHNMDNKLYYDGKFITSNAVAAYNINSIVVGNPATGGIRSCGGFLEEVRLTVGARQTQTGTFLQQIFTPPTEPFVI